MNSILHSIFQKKIGRNFCDEYSKHLKKFDINKPFVKFYEQNIQINANQKPNIILYIDVLKED